MPRAKRGLRSDTHSARLILDSGAVLLESKGDERVRAFVRQALSDGAELILPPIAVTETYRGSAADASLNRLLKRVMIPPTGEEVAKLAGRLLAQTGGSNAADAQVVAEAMQHAPCMILTSDVRDIEVLVGAFRGITILDAGRL